MYFEEMDIDERTKKALRKRGFSQATDVQERSIPFAMKGDVIVQAKTGSGKTLSFLIPIFEGIEGKGNEALILVPTRELAQQVEREARSIAKEYGFRTIAIYGGVSMDNQIKNLPASIIVGTPGRVMDLMRRGHLDLSGIKFLVLDEADRMLDMGFIDDIRWIISKANRNRRTLLYSATMPPEIIRLAKRYMRNPERIFLSKDEKAPEKIKQYYVEVSKGDKLKKLVTLLNEEKGKYLIFLNTKTGVQYLARRLREAGFPAREIHGDMRQASRTRVMDDFKAGKVNILIATDVASRGIDVQGITHVVNYDVPRYPKDYVHRIGRTGRMDANGKAITFVTPDDMEFLWRIEDYLGRKIKRIEIENGIVEEKEDYRSRADEFGMLTFEFYLARPAGEWEIVREAEKHGISEEGIGMIDLQGSRGRMKVHYRYADKIANVPIFEEVRLA